MELFFVLVAKIGDIGVTAFSVIAYVASFTAAVFIGTSEGFQPLFGQSYGARNERGLKFYFRASMLINLIGSVAVVGLILLFSRPICVLFGADPATLEYALSVMPMYSWGFVVMAFNVLISAYLYSTDRAAQAVVINVLRSIVVNVAVILILPNLFGPDVIWTTLGIYEIIVLAAAFGLLKHSERNGAIFKSLNEQILHFVQNSTCILWLNTRLDTTYCIQHGENLCSFWICSFRVQIKDTQ